MNPLATLRRALAGVAALATLATAAVAQVPRVQLALVSSFGGTNNSGAIHRIDLNTGKYLGSFGAGTLVNPWSITVQPGTGIAFVADDVAIKKFNVSTGRFLGNLARVTNFGEGGIRALRFNPSGALYAVGRAHVGRAGWTYNVSQIDPTTGATIHSILGTSASTNPRIEIGFRPFGQIEVVRRSNFTTFADLYDTGLTANLGFSAVTGNDETTLRTSSDAYLRVHGTQIQGGVGTFSEGPFADFVDYDQSAIFAEGALNQSYLVYEDGGTVQIRSFDTTEMPYTMGYLTVSYFGHNAFSDVAIYSK